MDQILSTIRYLFPKYNFRTKHKRSRLGENDNIILSSLNNLLKHETKKLNSLYKSRKAGKLRDETAITDLLHSIDTIEQQIIDIESKTQS